ncbi:hypothetical protein AAZX31_11G185300 [Glycine max]|uniref:Uncharacterized protein n=1 Tax=Glycine soja TaxID=3848 RepID=A0A0B2R2J3_GLYSO|nr:hypothetical protein JHK85_032152 [Glycine max]KAG4994758.1 hypothetical protein JHK86_031585 [Glycine max]KAG5124763.1 hypothetical protein JHK82_031500 [Glycine max]KAG5146179.1 hypothetical protein JHK84_031722 [Glycine max]KHN26479.1 hypothetical protein glysoja_044159 [Glycine soja]
MDTSRYSVGKLAFLLAMIFLIASGMCMESKTITGTLPKECSRDMDCRPYGCEILTPCGCLRKCIDFVCRCPNEAPPN